MTDNYEQEIVVCFEEEIKKHTAKMVKKDIPFEHGVSTVITALAFVLLSTLVSTAKSLNMDEEKFTLMVNDVCQKLKKFGNDIYHGKDDISNKKEEA